MHHLLRHITKIFVLLSCLSFFSAYGQVITGNVCWKDSYGRGVGTIPGECGPGQTKSGLLCYDNCKNGYNNEAGVCWSGCPNGTTDIGATCVKKDVSSYGRGAGYVIWEEGRCNRAHQEDWDKKIKVANLSAGVVVRAYEGTNFGGASIDLTPSGQVNLPDAWQGRIRSMKVRTMVESPKYGFTGATAVFGIEARIDALNSMLPAWSEAAAWYQTDTKSGTKVEAVRRLRRLEYELINAYALGAADGVKRRAYEQLQDYHENDQKKLLVYIDMPTTPPAILQTQAIMRSSTIAQMDSLARDKTPAVLDAERKKMSDERDELSVLLKQGPRGNNIVRDAKTNNLTYKADNVKVCFFDEQQNQGNDRPTSVGTMKGGKTACVTTDAEGNGEFNNADFKRMRSAFVPPNVQVRAYWKKDFNEGDRKRDLFPAVWTHFGVFEGGKSWDQEITSFKVVAFSPTACFWDGTDDQRKQSSEFRKCWQPDRDIAEMPKDGSCEKQGALWYPRCRPDYDGVGPVCWSTTKCTNGTTDAGLFCTKDSYVQAPITPSCGGKEYDAGLCYDKCNTGYNGIGPVCWGGCPSNMSSDCGAMCGKDKDQCGMAIGGQIVSSLEVVGTVAAIGATGGAAAAAKTGAVAAAKAAAKAIAKKLAKDELKLLVDKLNANTNLSASAKQALQGDITNLTKTFDKLNDFDPADLDPTGVADMVKAFNKPTCTYPAADKKLTPPTNAVPLSATVLAMMNRQPVASSGGTPAAQAPVSAPPPAASTAALQVIESRWLRGSCIDANTGTGFGVPQDGTLIWQCNGNSNQRFNYDFRANMITYPAKNLCLQSQTKSQAARFVACNTNDSKQKWTVDLGTNAIRNTGDNMCLDVNMGNRNNGGAVTTFDCHGRSNQAWSFMDDTPQKLSVLLEARHASNKCIDAAENGTNNTVLWQCDANKGNQKFFYDQTSKVITMPAKGLCLRSNGKEKQASFVPCETFDDQQWTIGSNNSIRSVRHGTCLDVSRNRNDDGAPIIGWDCTNATNQQWNFRQK